MTGVLLETSIFIMFAIKLKKDQNTYSSENTFDDFSIILFDYLFIWN